MAELGVKFGDGSYVLDGVDGAEFIGIYIDIGVNLLVVELDAAMVDDAIVVAFMMTVDCLLH